MISLNINSKRNCRETCWSLYVAWGQFPRNSVCPATSQLSLAPSLTVHTCLTYVRARRLYPQPPVLSAGTLGQMPRLCLSKRRRFILDFVPPHNAPLSCVTSSFTATAFFFSLFLVACRATFSIYCYGLFCWNMHLEPQRMTFSLFSLWECENGMETRWIPQRMRWAVRLQL